MPGSKNIRTGSYTDETAKSEIFGTYYDGTTTIDYAAGTELTNDARNEGKSITNHFNVVITKVDAKEIRGTFSGDFYKYDDFNQSKKTFTEGSFYVPLIQQ